MADFMRMCDTIETEINKIAEKGLTSSNIEIAYKLIDMYKDLKTVEAMEGAGYSEAMSYESYPTSIRSDRNSMRRRDSMGRYSRTGADPRDRYMSAKESYRYSHASNDKQSMMDSLDDYMNDMSTKLQEMMQDADTQEEREMIQRYINKVKMR
jgi:hypothetical protein